MEEMGDRERDSTQDRLLPERSKSPLVSELVERIDEALATARSSEAAAVSIGAAALDAAEQARRAAELAERASAAMRVDPPVPGPEPEPPARESAPGPSAPLPPVVALPLPAAEDNGLREFGARADRVAARLRDLERRPLSAAG